MGKGKRRGKSLENYVADLFMGYKQGLYGGEDVALQRFSIECKERQTPFKTLDKWMEQARDNCKGKVPMVYFHVNNQRHENDYVIFRAEDIQPIIQRIEDD